MTSPTSAGRRMGPGTLLRTMLFAPGNHPRRLEKAFTLGVDAVILDLEDAVPPAEKDAARHAVATVLAQRPAGDHPWAVVRINPLTTELTVADLEVTLGPAVAAVMLPKADSVADIKWLESELTRLELGRGLTPGSTAIIPMIESSLGILEARRIASASQRIVTLAFGTLDFVQDIGTSFSGEGTELLLARSTLVLACRSAGVGPPIDGVWPQLGDSAGLEREARHTKQLGFAGKTLLHPDQIGPVTAIFSPTADEVTLARQVIEAFEAAEAQGSGVVRVGDRFVDRPVVLWARRVLAAAQAIPGG